MQQVTIDDVKKVLEKVRPYLQQDGGDVEVMSVSEDNIVEVKLLGACNGCPMSMMTLRAGIERIIMLELPDVKRVESVN